LATVVDTVIAGLSSLCIRDTVTALDLRAIVVTSRRLALIVASLERALRRAVSTAPHDIRATAAVHAVDAAFVTHFVAGNDAVAAFRLQESRAGVIAAKPWRGVARVVTDLTVVEDAVATVARDGAALTGASIGDATRTTRSTDAYIRRPGIGSWTTDNRQANGVAAQRHYDPQQLPAQPGLRSA
jgi:hypothetical protein